MALLLLLGACDEPAKDSGESEDSADSVDSGFVPADCSYSTGWSFVAAGSMISCGIHTDGCAECWGHAHIDVQSDTGTGPYYDSGEDTPPDVLFRTIELPQRASYYPPGFHGCGVATNERIACWGRDSRGQADPPDDAFAAVDLLETGSCGLTTSGAILCWGTTMPPPDGRFSALSVGDDYGLALDPYGEATAWVVAYVTGLPDGDSPTGPFTAVAMGTFACALRPDGTLACWSPGEPARSKRIAAITPTGTFTQVAAGSDGACALDPKGRAVCFSDDPKADIVRGIPEASLTQVSVGNHHACGVTTDQRIVCWGSDAYGQASPPERPPRAPP